MAARSPRLRFANPFVITIAAALPAAVLATACVAETRPASNPPYPHTNPPGPNDQTASNPPPVNPHDGEGHEGHEGHQGHEGHHEHAPGTHTNPPPPRNPGTPVPPHSSNPPPPRNPGTPVPPQTSNPPPPANPNPSTGGGKPNPPRVTPGPGTTPPVTPQPPTYNPPPPRPPQTVSFEQKWTVRRNGDKCLAIRDANCPKPEKGQPVATCNPPPPIEYACPTGLLDQRTVTIIQAPNSTECRIPAHDANACPPNAKCALPKPGVVPCPTR